MNSLLDELAPLVARLADAVAPAVVTVEGAGRGGNGVVVADRRVLTNAHNVRSDRLAIRLGGGAREARLLGADADADVAILEADTAGIRPLTFSAEGPRLGSPVFAVAAGRDGPRVTFGLVSSVGRSFRGPRGRRISGSLEHTAAMAPGSSGSALVDAAGALVGINTHRLNGGFYLALPTDASLSARVDALAEGTAPKRHRLGVAVAPAWAARRMRQAVGLEPRDGLLVREVDADGPAAAAGISPGDLIVAVDGRAISDADDLLDAIDGVRGDRLGIDRVRGAEERRVEVAFEDGGAGA